MLDRTQTFSLGDDKEREMKIILTQVYDALREKGYNPINQLVGYILSEDPTYITTYNTQSDPQNRPRRPVAGVGAFLPQQLGGDLIGRESRKTGVFDL